MIKNNNLNKKITHLLNKNKHTRCSFGVLYSTNLVFIITDLKFLLFTGIFLLIISLIISIIKIKKLQKFNQLQQQKLKEEIRHKQHQNNELQNSKQRHQQLIDTIPYGIIETDCQWNITFCNKAICKMTQYHENEIITKNIRHFLASKQKIELLFRFAISRKPTPTPFQCKIFDSDGKEINIQADWNYKKDYNNDINGFIIIVTDIHEYQKNLQDLAIERDLLNALMDNIPYQIYFKDIKSRFIRINKRQAQIIGIEKPEDALGKTDFDYFPHAPKAYEDEQEIIKTGIPVIDKHEKIKIANGEIRWVSSTKIAIKGINGKVTGIVGISRDITEQKKAQEELKRAKEKAEESDRLKTAFLANMSHEIRTPMNAIIGFADLLTDPHLNLKNQAEYLNYISNSGRTLLTLIDDIIDIAKIEAGQIKIKKTQCDINEILTELHTSFKKQLQEKNKTDLEIRLSIPNQNDTLILNTDPYRFRQISSNLIGNAMKFTDRGTIEFGYEFTNNKIQKQNKQDSQNNKADYIQFYVKDSGIGMPQNKLNIIFKRFGQVEDTYNKNQRGTGLGLTISKNLTELLGGDMWVESQIGIGSTFYFTLPNKTSKSTKKIKEKQEINLDNIQWSDKTILVAEDVAINFKLIDVALRKTNVKILWAKTGLEAVQKVKEMPEIDLILMDIQMPEMDGYEATKKIKKLNPKITIIAQTAFAMSGEKEKSIEAGCDNYISKPIRKNLLMKLLHKYLNG